jgi:hypothetical protein
MSKLKVLFLGSAMFLWLAGSSSMALTCSKATLNGGYGALVSGVTAGVTIASGGLVIADGKGNLSGLWNANANGSVETNVAFTGKYTVSANCTGTAELIFSTGTAHFNIVVNGANGWNWIETDNDTVQAGYALSVGTATCSEAQIKGIWSWLQMSSYLVGSGPGASLNMNTFNGTGDVTATDLTGSANGTISTGLSGKGTYTVNSDCTGTITVNVKNLGSASDAFVVVNNGQEILSVSLQTNVVSIQTATPVVK